MKNEEKLLLSIGEISDDIIAEAEAPYKRRLAPTKKTLAIAASVAVVAVGITLLPGLLEGSFDKNSGGNSAPEMNGGMDGTEMNFDISETTHGILECIERTDGYSFNFKLTLYADLKSPLDVKLKSQNGSVVYTTEDASTEGVEVRRPTITVNGEVKQNLPTAAGEYDITISFDGMEADKKWQSKIFFTDFGPFHRFDWK